MQTDPTPSDTSDLREVWSSTARRATDAQLVACVVVGIAAAIGFGIGALVDLRLAWRFWPLVLLALLAGTFGIWGIADRELLEGGRQRWSRRALAATKWGSAIAAGIVAALVAIGILKLTIGTWIS
jgi:hypothetical protein